MIVISLVLVVISAISLLIGGLFRDDLDLIYLSIAAALAAAVFLGAGVLRGTRRRKPVSKATLPGEDAAARPATWQGAGWGGGTDDAALSRDDAADTQTAVIATTETVDETVRIDESAYAPPPPAADPAPAPPPTGGWAPPPAPASKPAPPPPPKAAPPRSGSTPPPPPPG